MKKIDVITLHRVKNYGSALQTYATQKIIKRLGYDCEIIDYYRKGQKESEVLEYAINGSHIFKKNMITRQMGKIFLGASIKKQIKIYNDFYSKNVKLTKKKYYSLEELKNDVPEADVYCTGSDQVWNSDWNKGIDKAFFLDFVPNGKRKVAYAASFGKEQLDNFEIDETKQLLSKYDCIGVRESSAKRIIEDLNISKKVEHVLDPTLLCSKEDWMELKVDIPHKDKYILVYQLNSRNKKFDRYVKELSKYKKLPIIRVSNVGYQKYKYGKFVNCPTVEEFISYFINASYIVTDSFHATAYAINLNKQFIDIFPPKFGTRLQSILDLTNLQSRKVIDFNNFELIDEKIDYAKVNEILESEREKSLNFLKNAIEE